MDRPEPYTMHIESEAGVMQHPFHLGTILSTAESFVMEKLMLPLVKSVALRQGGELVRIYDWRDLPEEKQRAREDRIRTHNFMNAITASAQRTAR